MNQYWAIYYLFSISISCLVSKAGDSTFVFSYKYSVFFKNRILNILSQFFAWFGVHALSFNTNKTNLCVISDG